MINAQLISFKNGLSPFTNAIINTTRSAVEKTVKVFVTMQLLPIIATITAVASIAFGIYKLAIHLGYFSPSEHGDFVPSAPPCEEDFIEFEFVSPSAPPLEEEFSESSPEMQKNLFSRYYPNFGHP